jgi:hypothetical protein
MSYFCNATTHVRNAPTKHNLMCGHRSVMDVVRSNSDVAAAPHSSSFAPPVVDFKQDLGSREPELIVVLDTGRNMEQAGDTLTPSTKDSPR